MSEASQPIPEPMFTCDYRFIDDRRRCGCSLCTPDGSETFDCEACLEFSISQDQD